MVAVVDKDPKAFERLGEEFSGQTVEGIGFDRDVLEQAGVARADALVAVTGGDNSNVVAARVARDAYRVPRVIARIHDPRRAALYEELGSSPCPRPTGRCARSATTWSTAPSRRRAPSGAARSRCSAWSCPSTWSTARWPTSRARGSGWSASPAGRGVRARAGHRLAEGDVVRLAGADGRGRLDALLAEEATREEAGREVAG